VEKWNAASALGGREDKKGRAILVRKDGGGKRFRSGRGMVVWGESANGQFCGLTFHRASPKKKLKTRQWKGNGNPISELDTRPGEEGPSGEETKKGLGGKLGIRAEEK